MVSADNCYLFAETKDQMLKMEGDVTANQRKRGLDWTGGSDGIDFLGP